MELSTLDWLIIFAYMPLNLTVAILVSRRAAKSVESYFIADRSVPWWWAGASIAGTTFAADTPLAVTGIIASKGLVGNWVWWSWILLHASIIFIFAEGWRRSLVMTDAEIIHLRYSGPEAKFLRWFKASLYGIVFNCIILGWVLKAMSKIMGPFLHWDRWFPGLYSSLITVWPEDFVLGGPAQTITLVALLALVGIYSSIGGMRGLMVTDLIQLVVALTGAYLLAYYSLKAVGGTEGLVSGLARAYGENHHFLDLFPDPEKPWMQSIGLGFFGLGVYFLVQSYANNPADGGGYFMQRLATCKDEEHAKKASLLFVVIQYIGRVWPWVITALAALVLIPIGGEKEAFNGAVGFVAGDREASYPALMAQLLPDGLVGLMVVSLLAAFMSSVDTHLNWGASYIVNDFFRVLYPNSTRRTQMIVARAAVLGFAALAIIVASQINTIEQAWKWIAVLGAGLGAPTALRWLWWRINAWSEIGAIILGLGTAIAMTASDMAFEKKLIVVGGAGLLGALLGVWFGRPTNPENLQEFVDRVQPFGFWPQKRQYRKSLVHAVVRILVLVVSLLSSLWAGQAFILGETLKAWVLTGVFFATMLIAFRLRLPAPQAQTQ